jgi:hypothetical protein
LRATSRHFFILSSFDAEAANRETDKAKADYQKILKLNPQDAFAKKQLEELNRGKQ